jgi:hypothetical protein
VWGRQRRFMNAGFVRAKGSKRIEVGEDASAINLGCRHVWSLLQRSRGYLHRWVMSSLSVSARRYLLQREGLVL